MFSMWWWVRWTSCLEKQSRGDWRCQRGYDGWWGGNGLWKKRSLPGAVEQIEAQQRNPTKSRGLNSLALWFSLCGLCNWTDFTQSDVWVFLFVSKSTELDFQIHGGIGWIWPKSVPNFVVRTNSFVVDRQDSDLGMSGFRGGGGYKAMGKINF